MLCLLYGLLATVLTMRVPSSIATLAKLVFSEMRNPNNGTITHHFTILVASPNVLATRRSALTCVYYATTNTIHRTCCHHYLTARSSAPLRPSPSLSAPSYRSASAIALSFGVPEVQPWVVGSLMWLSGSPSCIVASMTDIIYSGNQ